mgnify:CR=1 FL=1
MTSFRPLKTTDFSDFWELGQEYIDPRLRADMTRAVKTYGAMLADRTNYMVGEFEGDQMVGAVVIAQIKNAYALKSFGSVYIWMGSVALLDDAIAWWEGRPVMRCLGLQFPRAVSPAIYRLLRMRGFTREGDMNMLWRS